MATEWKPEYICTLTEGCVHPSRGHSLNCQEKNKVYAEAARVQERKRRLDQMNAVIRGEDDDAS